MQKLMQRQTLSSLSTYTRRTKVVQETMMSIRMSNSRTRPIRLTKSQMSYKFMGVQIFNKVPDNVRKKSLMAKVELKRYLKKITFNSIDEQQFKMSYILYLNCF